MGVPKYRNQLTTNVQEHTDNNTMTGDFNNHLGQWTASMQKINRGTIGLTHWTKVTLQI